MKKTITAVVLGLIGVGIIGGFLYTHIWNPSWNPFRPSPEVVLIKAALKMKGLKSFHMEGDIKTEYIKETRYEQERSSSRSKERDIGISLDIDKNNPKTLNFYLKGNGNFSSKSQWLDRKRSSDYWEKLEFKKIGDFLYFIFSGKELEKPLFSQWIKVNRGDVGDLATLLLFKGETEKIEIKMSEKRQEELIEEIIKLFVDRGPDLFKVKQELPDEKINNQMAYHYLITLNEKEVKHLISDIILKASESIEESIYISDPDSFRRGYDPYSTLYYVYMFNAELQEGISDFFEQMEGVDLEVWIGQKDDYLHRIRFKKEKDLVNYFEQRHSGRAELEILKAEKSVLVDVDLSEFDAPIEIKTPQEFKNLEELRKEFEKKLE